MVPLLFFYLFQSPYLTQMKRSTFTFHLAAILLIFTSCKSATTTTTDQHSATLTILVTESYCGGARPTDALEQELATPHPYANKTLYLINSKGEAKDIKTNSSGQLVLTDESGSFKFFTAEKYLAEIGSHDPEGCKNWKAKPDYQYVLKTDVSASIIEFHISCNRCELPAP